MKTETENKKDKAQNRNLYIKIRVNQAEMDLIKRKFRESGMQTFSGFIRTMILEGYIVKIDESKFQEIHKLATSIARNVNQITTRPEVSVSLHILSVYGIFSGFSA